MEMASRAKRLVVIAEIRVIVELLHESWDDLVKDLHGDDWDLDTSEGDSRQLFEIYHSSVYNSTR
jgi:hypothetical protein